MLPAPARLRRREDFTLVVRRGRRSGRSTLVAHYLASQSPGLPARVGFVVGRAVGNSVVRHRTVRQLRHLVRERLDRLPAGSTLVVRALPPAAAADSTALGRDLDAALTRLLTSSPTPQTAAASTAPGGPRGPGTPIEPAVRSRPTDVALGVPGDFTQPVVRSGAAGVAPGAPGAGRDDRASAGVVV